MKIIEYSKIYDKDIQNLILNIQNKEAKINLSLEEQPDLQNIDEYFIKSGGMFWIALYDNNVVGTIGLKKAVDDYAILKKFFVKSEYRGQKIGLELYKKLICFSHKNGIKLIVLDTPSVAEASHTFYKKSGFKVISKSELPFEYNYPDRNSILMALYL